MSVMTLAPPPSVVTAPAFPTAAVEADLRSELIEAIKAEAMIRGVTLPAAAGAIAQTPFQVDSLVVVSILVAIEPLVGFELPESVVRTGGYASVEQAIGQLLPKIEAQWKKRKGAKP